MKAVRLLFYEQGGIRYPQDLELFQKADNFAKAEMTNFSLNSGDVYVVLHGPEVLAIGCLANVPACTAFRVKKSEHATKATKVLWDRLNNVLADHGCKGALLHLAESEPDGTRCPKWKEWLLKAGATVGSWYEVAVK